MLFHQLVTGRAPAAGWGFIAYTDGFPCTREERTEYFLCSRNNAMPSGARIFEVQSLPEGRIAAFCTFMEGGTTVTKYCYTHALLPEESISADEALGLLTTINYLNADQFADLESIKGPSHGLIPAEKRIFGNAPYHVLNLQEANALAAFIPYYWKQCQVRRSDKRNLLPAGLIVSTNENYIREAISLFRTYILPVLPKQVAQMISVVFGITWNTRAAFSNTVCYVMPSLEGNPSTFFDMPNGSYKAETLDDLDIKIGKQLLEGNIPSLYKQLTEQRPNDDELLSDYNTIRIACAADVYFQDVEYLSKLYPQAVEHLRRKGHMTEEEAFTLLYPIEQQIMLLLAQNATEQTLRASINFYSSSHLIDKRCFMQVMNCATKVHPKQAESLQRVRQFICRISEEQIDQNVQKAVLDFYETYNGENNTEAINEMIALMRDTHYSNIIALLQNQEYLYWQLIRDRLGKKSVKEALNACYSLSSLLELEEKWTLNCSIRPTCILAKAWECFELRDETYNALERVASQSVPTEREITYFLDKTNKTGDWYYESLRLAMCDYLLSHFDEVWKANDNKEQLLRLYTIAKEVPGVSIDKAKDGLSKFVQKIGLEIAENRYDYLDTDFKNDKYLKEIDDGSIAYLRTRISHAYFNDVTKELYLSVLKGRGETIEWYDVLKALYMPDSIPEVSVLDQYKPWMPDGAQLLNVIFVAYRSIQNMKLPNRGAFYADSFLTWLDDRLSGFTNAVRSKKGKAWKRFFRDKEERIPAQLYNWTE